MKLELVISGGQTGAAQAGWRSALGIGEWVEAYMWEVFRLLGAS